MTADAGMIVLIKPQFEAGRSEVRRYHAGTLLSSLGAWVDAIGMAICRCQAGAS